MRMSDWSSDVCSSDLHVAYALQQLRLTPKERPGQQVIHDWTVEVEGGSRQLHYTDHHGNGVDLVSVDSGAPELVIHCTGEVELVTWDDRKSTRLNSSP